MPCRSDNYSGVACTHAGLGWALAFPVEDGSTAPGILPGTLSSPCPCGQPFSRSPWEEPLGGAPEGCRALYPAPPAWVPGSSSSPWICSARCISHPLREATTGLEASVRRSLRSVTRSRCWPALMTDVVLGGPLPSARPTEPSPSYGLTTHKPLPLTHSLL